MMSEEKPANNLIPWYHVGVYQSCQHPFSWDLHRYNLDHFISFRYWPQNILIITGQTISFCKTDNGTVVIMMLHLMTIYVIIDKLYNNIERQETPINMVILCPCGLELCSTAVIISTSNKVIQKAQKPYKYKK